MSNKKNKRLSAKNNKKSNDVSSTSSSDEYNDDYNYSDENEDNTILVKKSKQLKKKSTKIVIINSNSDETSSTDIDDSSMETPIENSKIFENVVKKNSIKNSNEIFKELIKKQLPDVPSQWKLNINDMKRICKYISTSIFDKNTCCMWNGYITNMNNSNKGTYVNFYFRNKKVALHRLLYSNFVAPLDSSKYLKFNCDNKGSCCNINHYEIYKYEKYK